MQGYRHSGATPDHSPGLRDPESRNFKEIWIPACAGMTIGLDTGWSQS
jgi:hypothetical protein